MKGLYIFLGTVSILAVITIVVATGFIVQRLAQPHVIDTITPTPLPPTPTPPTTPIDIPKNIPHVEGAQIIDGSGHPLILRGAQIQSSLAFIRGWKKPETVLNSTIFHVMAHDWKMNVLRLPTSNWIYAKDPTKYMNELDTIIQEANAAGLYVVIDLHDNAKSGSPYVGNDVPKPEDIAYWKIIAAHFKNNPMVMFDVFNEPQVRGWQAWLHGGGTVGNGTPIVGFQDLVDAVRSVGAKQIIVVEPGSAGGDTGESGSWASVGNNLINDSNIVYSLHVYRDISLSPAQQDAKWGPILNHHPIYYGEWAFLPNSQIPIQCRNVPHDQADQIVTSFLHYMESRQANWTAWSFTFPYLIQDTSTFAPTTLDVPWACGDTTVTAGMGTIVKRYLTTGQ